MRRQGLCARKYARAKRGEEKKGKLILLCLVSSIIFFILGVWFITNREPFGAILIGGVVFLFFIRKAIYTFPSSQVPS
jgi:cytochrome oxidase assembly protein ShyY1